MTLFFPIGFISKDRFIGLLLSMNMDLRSAGHIFPPQAKILDPRLIMELQMFDGWKLTSNNLQLLHLIHCRLTRKGGFIMQSYRHSITDEQTKKRKQVLKNVSIGFIYSYYKLSSHQKRDFMHILQ